jgi:hypothetical protein
MIASEKALRAHSASLSQNRHSQRFIGHREYQSRHHAQLATTHKQRTRKRAHAPQEIKIASSLTTLAHALSLSLSATCTQFFLPTGSRCQISHHCCREWTAKMSGGSKVRVPEQRTQHCHQTELEHHYCQQGIRLLYYYYYL